jgi:hypothetical protein
MGINLHIRNTTDPVDEVTADLFSALTTTLSENTQALKDSQNVISDNTQELDLGADTQDAGTGTKGNTPGVSGTGDRGAGGRGVD